MPRSAIRAVGVSLLLAACSSPLTPVGDAALSPRRSSASPDAATNTTLALHFIRSNECTGEDVEITGTIHLVSQTQPDGSIIGHFNYEHVTGVGLTSGTEYRVSAVDQVRLAAPFPSSIQSVRSFRMIAAGSAPDLIVDALTHITVTANGDVSVTIESLDTRCAGD